MTSEWKCEASQCVRLMTYHQLEISQRSVNSLGVSNPLFGAPPTQADTFIFCTRLKCPTLFRKPWLNKIGQKHRLHWRCLNDITTLPQFSVKSGSTRGWWGHVSTFLEPGLFSEHLWSQVDTLIYCWRLECPTLFYLIWLYLSCFSCVSMWQANKTWYLKDGWISDQRYLKFCISVFQYAGI